MKKLIIGGLMMFCSSVYATSIHNAKIIQIRVDKTGIGMIVFDQPLQGTNPACINPTYKNALAFDTNSAGGKSILSVALTAKAQNANVFAYGLNSCAIFGGAHVEDLDYMISN